MIIWFALSIPILAAPALYFVFRHKIVWWEAFIPILVCMLFIAVMKAVVEKSQTTDVEYWTNYAVQACYYEPWVEEYDTVETETTTDSKGRTHTRTYIKHHVVHHPPRWEMQNNVGQSEGISKDYFHWLCKIWGNRQRKSLYHTNQTSIGDGGIHWTDWNQDRNTMIVLTSTHWYENRIIASHSVFKFPEIEDKSALFEYPKIEDHTNVPSVLGVPNDDPANRFLCVRNAELGVDKQIRMWVLVFNDAPLQAGIDQESYWQGGNKNELVVCIGTNDKKEVKWCYVFSWTEVERLKIDVRQFIYSQPKLDLRKSVEFMADAAEKSFIRKEFIDFNYLTVEPPAWAIITTYLITLLIAAGIGVWAVLNDLNEEDDPLTNSIQDWWNERFGKYGICTRRINRRFK
jgi:hypothetical protein